MDQMPSIQSDKIQKECWVATMSRVVYSCDAALMPKKEEIFEKFEETSQEFLRFFSTFESSATFHRTKQEMLCPQQTDKRQKA
jgi:hypothetical protein